jgi:heat shock protein 1/8
MDPISRNVGIGIDLGTANTCTAIYRNDNVEIIPHEGQSLMPSYVAFTETGRLVGSAAKRQAGSNPKNTIYGALRFIGRKFADREVQHMIKDLPFQVKNKHGRPAFSVRHGNSTLDLTPVEIIAMILARSRKDAQKYLAQSSPISAVISIPANFSLRQRQEILDAAFIAGITVLRLVNGAVNACRDYAMASRSLDIERNVLIADVGAGTVDVVVAAVLKDVIQVKAAAGNSLLGGDDFDSRLVSYAAGIFKKKTGCDLTGSELMTDVRALCRLRSACEQAKQALSAQATTRIEIDQLCDGLDLACAVTRQDLEAHCEELLLFCMCQIEETLKAARMDRANVHAVALIGGMSRIPKLQDLVTEYFNFLNPVRFLSPDEAPARGAAIYAAVLVGDTSSSGTSEMRLHDVSPTAIRIEALDGTTTPILKTNTVIPARKTMTFYASQNERDNLIASGKIWKPIIKRNPSLHGSPDDFLVSVFEGESKHALANRWLGDTMLFAPPNADGNRVIVVSLQCDADLRMVIEAQEKISHAKARRLVILDPRRLTQDQLEAMKNRAIKFDTADDVEEQRIEAKNNLEDAIFTLRAEGTTESQTGLADDVLDWLDGNQAAPEADFNRMLKLIAKKTAGQHIEQNTIGPEQGSKRETTDEGYDSEAGSGEVNINPDDLIGGGKSSESQRVPVSDESASVVGAANHAQVEIQEPTPTSIAQKVDGLVEKLEDTTKQKDEREFHRKASDHVVAELSHPSTKSATENVARILPERPLPRRYTSDNAAGSSEQLPTQSDIPGSLLTALLSRDTPPWSPMDASSCISTESLDRPPDTPGSSERGITELFSGPSEERINYSDVDFKLISTYLSNMGKSRWSLVPRLYTVLRLIDQLDMLDTFIEQDITDIWFPFTQGSLPRAMSPSARTNFEKYQSLVLSKSLRFEKDRRHDHFASGEPLPFHVVAKLGSGLHGYVDKVMSTVSGREYARKQFRRQRSASKDAVRSFMVELQALKKIKHYHCIELVGLTKYRAYQGSTDSSRYKAILTLDFSHCSWFLLPSATFMSIMSSYTSRQTISLCFAVSSVVWPTHFNTSTALRSVIATSNHRTSS